MQPSQGEHLGVEELVPAKGRTEQAIDLGVAGAVCINSRKAAANRVAGDYTGVGAGIGWSIVARLEERDREEVGAVRPYIEVSERKHVLGGCSVDRAVRIDAEGSGIGTPRHVR